MTDSTCSIGGCKAPVGSRGWCKMHYERWRLTGSTSLRRSAHQVLPGEQWLPVVGFEISHEVSDLGRVRSFSRLITDSRGITRRHTGRMLIPRLSGTKPLQYYAVTLSMRSQRKVHSLVLEAFVGPRLGDQEGCHDNGDHHDNRLVNLYWGTHSQNTFDMVRHGRHNNARVDYCPLNHLLVSPNLVAWHIRAGNRACLACARARASRQSATRRGWHVDLRALADRKYAEIMSQVL